MSKNKPIVTFASHERLQYVLDLVRKNVNAALGGVRGMRFWVYPPKEFLDAGDVSKVEGIHERLKDTVWWVKWYDGAYNQLTFGEFLAFVEQTIRAEIAFKEAVKAKESVAAKLGMKKTKRVGAHSPKKDPNRKPKPKAEDADFKITIKDTKDTAMNLEELATDGKIRQLLDAVDIESSTRPAEAVN